MIHKVLRTAWECQKSGVPYVDNSAQVGAEPHHTPLIKPGSVEEQLVADAVEDNVSYEHTVDIVNGHITSQHTHTHTHHTLTCHSLTHHTLACHSLTHHTLASHSLT